MKSVHIALIEIVFHQVPFNEYKSFQLIKQAGKMWWLNNNTWANPVVQVDFRFLLNTMELPGCIV